MSGLKEDITELAARRARLEQELKATERQIYELESGYLEETQQYGNVLRGWDGYLASNTYKSSGLKKKIRPQDRLFSLSSATYENSVHGDKAE